jgi:hypothetical protein
MPIKGLTDSVQAAFPRIGKLRKGGEAKRNQQGQVVGMGADLDHFRFSSDRPEVVAAFEEAYGEAPALVTAYLPYADVERNFQCWKEKWAAGGLVHRCDGETMTVWQGSDGRYYRTPKPCDGGCDEVGRLSLIIPELVRAGFVGYVVLETHGINDLLSIQASLMAALESRAGNQLGLRGIQWTLRRVKEKVSTPMGNGRRARRDKWLVKLEPAADWVQLQLQTAHNATMMLPAPSAQPAAVQASQTVQVDPESGEIIDSTAELVADEEAPLVDDEPPTVEAEPVTDDYIPDAISDLDADSQEVYLGWRQQIRKAKTPDELKAVWTRIYKARATLPEVVYQELERDKDECKADFS